MDCAIALECHGPVPVELELVKPFDELSAKISRATSLAGGGHPHLRKECGVQLRDAGERFCKEMLVRDARVPVWKRHVSHSAGERLEVAGHDSLQRDLIDIRS
jgi:hypothetical protein